MKIAIIDHEFSRVIYSTVPKLLADTYLGEDDEENKATAILTALGLSSGNCDYIICHDDDDVSLYTGPLDDLVGDFQENLREALLDLDDELQELPD